MSQEHAALPRDIALQLTYLQLVEQHGQMVEALAQNEKEQTFVLGRLAELRDTANTHANESTDSPSTDEERAPDAADAT